MNAEELAVRVRELEARLRDVARVCYCPECSKIG